MGLTNSKKAEPPTIKSFASNVNKDLARQGKHLAEVQVRDGRVYAVARTGIRSRGQQGGFVFWIVNPTLEQLDLLSMDQDWSLRYGDIFVGKDNPNDFRTLRSEPGQTKSSDVYLMHATVSVGIDDDHVWNAIQRSPEEVAEFTLAGSCDLSGTNPPGWAPGTYRVDLYVREIGETLDGVKLPKPNKEELSAKDRRALLKANLPWKAPLLNDWFMNGTHTITDSILFEVKPMDKKKAVVVKDIERQKAPKTYVVTDDVTGNETQIFESAVVAEGLDVGPNVHSFAVNTNHELAKIGIHQNEIGVNDGCVYAVAQTGIRTRRQQAGFVFWIENPTPEQLACLSTEQDWSDRWGGFMLTDEVRERSSGSAIEAALKFVKTETGSDEVPEFQRTVRHTQEEGGDVLLSHYMLELGVDDDKMWMALQTNPTLAKSAEFTLSSNLDLSNTTPPGWAPGTYRVDLYVCELGDLVPVGTSPNGTPLKPTLSSRRLGRLDGEQTPLPRVGGSRDAAYEDTPDATRNLNESLAGAAMGGGGAGKDDNSLIRTPTPSTSDSEAGSGDPMRSALALVQQMEAKAITDGAEARAEPSKAQDPSKQAAGGAAGQGSTSRRNMPGTTGTTGTTGTAKATSGHSGDDEYSDGDAYEFVDELEEDGSGSDGARPWSQTGLEKRTTELDQPLTQRYRLDNEKWFLDGTHPITRSIHFTVKGKNAPKLQQTRNLD